MVYGGLITFGSWFLLPDLAGHILHSSTLTPLIRGTGERKLLQGSIRVRGTGRAAVLLVLFGLSSAMET